MVGGQVTVDGQVGQVGGEGVGGQVGGEGVVLLEVQSVESEENSLREHHIHVTIMGIIAYWQLLLSVKKHYYLLLSF